MTPYALARGAERIGRREALLLLAHVTGKSSAELLIQDEIKMPESAYRAFFDGIERREAGEPLQHIMKEWDFFGLKMKVDERALIPRPETELLVEAVVKRAGGWHRPPRILDICTGSGCIAVALAVHTNAEITATDISPAALSLAAENAALHGVKERVLFIETDLAQGICGEFDIIVSNPPYIPTAELSALQAEVRGHEPRLALDGGDDGMDIYRRMLPQAYKKLIPRGGLFLEIGPGEVAVLVEQAGFVNVRVIKDYAGLERIVAAEKPQSP